MSGSGGRSVWSPGLVGDVQEDVHSDDDSGGSVQEFVGMGVGRMAEIIQGVRRIWDIKDLPGGGFLRSIAPQTPSVDVIGVILRMEAVRRVKVRQGAAEVEVVVVVVGDESGVRFEVSFWLKVGRYGIRDGQWDCELRENVLGLCVGDVVLMRQVGLRCFGNMVRGFSIRTHTKVDVLQWTLDYFQQRYGDGYASGRGLCGVGDVVIHKFCLVRSWWFGFGGVRFGMGRCDGSMLPPDTP